MSATTETASEQFTWEVQPAAARWVARVIDSLAARNPAIARLGRILRERTGTRLVDWVDHLALDDADGDILGRELLEIGYVEQPVGGRSVWRNRLGMFPPVITDGQPARLAIRCDCVDDCLAALPSAMGLPRPAEDDNVGERGGPCRTARLDADGVELSVVERHGHPAFSASAVRDEKIAAAARHLEAFRGRSRRLAQSADGFRRASERFDAAANELGTAWACDLFFQAEREYWQSRNHAGQVQYERQNRLGLGWANHDHHTYRSSRVAFPNLIGVLEQMGFQCRERFYAGREA
ncbi:MAG: hypothetical protein WD229_08170, partial [Pirellulales bacterium]